MAHRIHDVVVVGGGPAGSRTARALARRGFEVAVLEEHRAVGEPCHCSGLVTPRTLELAGVGTDIVRNTIRGAVIHARDCDPATIGGDRVHAYVIDRVELDRRLGNEAQDAGAAFLLKHRAVAFRTTDDHVALDIRRDGVADRIRARLLIGADGAMSTIGRQLRGAPVTGTVMGLGGVADYDRNPLSDHVEVFLDPHSAPGWFGWTIPLGDGLARVGTGSANGIKPRESFGRLRSSFPATFGAARIRSHSGGTIALWAPTPMVGDRVMLVGDAARQVKPTSGGGIHAALKAADLAAEVAAAALHRGNLSRASLQPYEDQWHRVAGQELRRQHDMRRAFTRLSADDLSALVPLLRDCGLRSAIDEASDIDFPSRMVAALARRHPRLLFRLLPMPRYPGAWLSRS